MSGSKLLSSKGDEGESEIFHHLTKCLTQIFTALYLLQLSINSPASHPYKRPLWNTTVLNGLSTRKKSTGQVRGLGTKFSSLKFQESWVGHHSLCAVMLRDDKSSFIMCSHAER